MNDYGYFGDGLEGYAHYMQSFNDNFPEDDAYDDESFEEFEDETFDDFENYSLNKNISTDILYNCALNSIQAIKSEITCFISSLNKNSFNSSLYVLETDMLAIYDKQFDLMNEAITYLKSIESYLYEPSILAAHHQKYYQYFLNLNNNNIKLLEQKVKIMKRSFKSLPADYETTDTDKEGIKRFNEKYLAKLEQLEKRFLDLKI